MGCGLVRKASVKATNFAISCENVVIKHSTYVVESCDLTKSDGNNDETTNKLK